MKKSALLAMLVVAPALSLAQGGPPPGKGPGAMRMFDPATVVTVTAMMAGFPSKVIFDPFTEISSPFANFTVCLSTQKSGPRWTGISPSAVFTER